MRLYNAPNFWYIDMFSHVWYNIVMIDSQVLPKAYTPEQAAAMLQLSKNTIYQLIGRGEIVAKKIGKVYRIPQSSLSFIFSGLDEDLLRAQKEDFKNLDKIQSALAKVRKNP